MTPSVVTSTSSFAATLLSADQPQVEHATPLEDDEDRLDAFYDDKPL
jgi:hypothetical protein